jgi:hypothetical protein
LCGIGDGDCKGRKDRAMVKGASEEREGVWVAKRVMLMSLRRTEGVDPGKLDEVAWRKIETAYISVVPFMHLARSRQLCF